MESIFRATLSKDTGTWDESIIGAIPTKGDLMSINIDYADGHTKIFYDVEEFEIDYMDMTDILGKYVGKDIITEYCLDRFADGEILIYFNPLRNTLDEEAKVAKNIAKQIQKTRRH